jgi:hypothetical protein
MASARRWAGGILAIVGGVLMVYSGYASRGFLLSALQFAGQNVGSYLAGIEGLTVELAITILATLVALGGLTVVAGGIIILTGHSTTGRILISLGGGAGFLGLLISFGLASYKLGLSSAEGYLWYWVGLVFAIVGRRVAKGS